MTVITLTTDFGSGGAEAGVLKGVIWGIAPNVKIADLSHAITPHAIIESAILLWRVAPFFPDGTIHVVVVDPGVGTSRRGIVAHLGSQYFVGPDNGIVSMLLETTEGKSEHIEFVHLDQPQYWLPEVTSVFHGRDIFAPVAAHLAQGVVLNSLGTPISDPIRLEIPKPTRALHGWFGQVIHIDHFGNLATNLYGPHIDQAGNVMVKINGQKITGLVSTFGERPPGSLVALLDSSGSLAISVVNGSAAGYLHASIGDTIEILSYGISHPVCSHPGT
jgi:S-adenosyl-L-methionine hydrolase (adenosine-forming)